MTIKIHHQTAKKAKAHQIELTVEDGEIVASQNGVRLAAGLAGNVVLQQALNRLGGDAVKEIKAPKAKAPKKAKEVSAYEVAAREEGWKPVRKGGFKQTDVDAEEGGTSDAETWAALCDEQDIEIEGQDDAEGDDEEGETKSIVKPKYRALYRPHKNTNGDGLAAQLRDYLTYEDDETGETRIDGALLKRFAVANGCWVESYSSLKNVGMRRMNCANRLRAKLRKDPEFKIDWVE